MVRTDRPVMFPQQAKNLIQFNDTTLSYAHAMIFLWIRRLTKVEIEPVLFYSMSLRRLQKKSDSYFGWDIWEKYNLNSQINIFVKLYPHQRKQPKILIV